jgi:hypothetical protein
VHLAAQERRAISVLGIFFKIPKWTVTNALGFFSSFQVLAFTPPGDSAILAQRDEF